MRHYQQIYSHSSRGFHVVLSITPEDIHPRDLFDDSEYDISEICRKIDNGTYEWFCARVEAYKHGILLGAACLGGNLYDDAREFITDDPFDDLMDKAIFEAEANLTKLTQTEAA
jgi:hypothetical protein